MDAKFISSVQFLADGSSVHSRTADEEWMEQATA